MRPPFHKNCKCQIVDGELILDKDACDYCKKIKRENFSKNNNINMKHVKLKVNKKDWEKFKVSYVQDPAMEGEDMKYFSKDYQFAQAKIYYQHTPKLHLNNSKNMFLMLKPIQRWRNRN